jgi:WD40 repeat protein
MLVKQLDFEPQVIWSQNNKFNVWGFNKIAKPKASYIHYVHTAGSICYQTGGKIYPYLYRAVENKHGVFLLNYNCYLYLNELKVEKKQHYDYKNARRMIPKQFKNIIQEWVHYDYNKELVVFCFWGGVLIGDYHLKTEVFCQDVKISPDGNTVALAFNNSISFFDVSSKIIKYQLTYGKSTITNISYAQDGLTIAAVNQNNEMIVWDVE